MIIFFSNGEGDGLFFMLIAVDALIGFLFFDFYVLGSVFFNVFESIKYMFSNIETYISTVQNISTIFNLSIINGVFVLYLAVFVLASIILLMGLNKNASGAGKLFLLHPIAYLTNGILEFTNDLITSIRFGFIFQFFAGLFVMIGSMKNRE